MLNEPEIVKIKEVDYKVEGFTIEVQQAFERMMEAEFLEIIKSNKQAAGDDYLPLIQKHFYDVKTGAYKWRSSNFWMFVNEEENFVELMHWVFSKHQAVLKVVIKEWIDAEPELSVALFNRLMDASKKN